MKGKTMSKKKDAVTETAEEIMEEKPAEEQNA